MWKLPDGRFIHKPCDIEINGIKYNKNIFHKLSVSKLVELGILPVREVNKFNSEFFELSKLNKIEYPDYVEINYTVSPKYSIVELRKKQLKKLSKICFDLYIKFKNELEYLLVFEPNSTKILKLNKYIDKLKLVYAEKKKDISTLNVYNKLVEFDFADIVSIMDSSEIIPLSITNTN